jgi:formate dehydrogenase iron-sulfur subunit
VRPGDQPGHPAQRADGGAGSALDPTAGFATNVGTPHTTPLTGQTERAEHLGMPGVRPPRYGFFTDTSVCIGCKACEVACKEWNHVPADAGGSGSGPTDAAALRDMDLLSMSYDNTGALGASTWRHVAFVEAPAKRGNGDVRWLMSSDVCKHCTHAACLDVCPTGSLIRTEFDTVYVQPDICNGCGYCVPACPYGVIDIRPEDGRAFKCTLCYDRTRDGLTPACAQACPTESIQFGPLDELRERADRRLAQLHGQGVVEAQLYGRSPDDGVGGDGAFFLLLDEPEVYGLPPDPVVTTRDLPAMWKRAALAAAGLAVAVAGAFLGGG